MLQVPGWVAQALSLQDDYPDAEALRADLAAFEGNPAAPFAGVDDLVEAIASPPLARVEFVRASPITPWRFVDISIGLQDRCFLVELSSDITEAAPTASIRTVLRAWLLTPEASFSEILTNHSGEILVAWEKDGSGFTGTMCATLAGLKLPDIGQSKPFRSTQASAIVVPASAFLVREAKVYEGILQAAIRNNSPPLRFLYLYRVFERAYLIDAIEKLQRNFFDDPKRSLKTAENTVANEKASFLALIEGTTAEPFFVDLENLFQQALINLSNRFMIALMKDADEEGELNHKESWRRGCVLIYKMRCAVVHSGKAGPVFESFADAAAACQLVVDKLEDAAFALLGVTMT